MVRFTGGLLLLTALSLASPVENRPPSQHVLDVFDARAKEGNPRKLRGKFLHITDLHPDPFYKQGTDADGQSCHRGKGDAGYFGAEKTECDSPFSLVNATFDWIKHNIKDEIDFVIWTGDSARHDNDEKYPRTVAQVRSLNEFVVTKFDEVFGKPENRNDPDPTNDFVVPIVPTYGNNDFLPHNIFEPGPNKWTRRYLEIWEKFVPQEQRHTFARGGWFFTEVIPNRLAVFSLNTMYFFDSNAAVDGCDADTEPGYEHFEWLRIQLEFLRQRKMKAILMGHVPPARTESKQNWDETCYQKYTLWLRQYRDVIVGNLFGHMNVDHFILQDVRELTYKFKIKGIDDEGLRNSGPSISSGFHAQAKPDYLNDLRERWGKLPNPPRGTSFVDADVETTKSKSKKKRKKLDKFIKDMGGLYGERFSLSFVSPSVVPNYYPTLRIIEYNITGLKHEHPASAPTAPTHSDSIYLDVPTEPWVEDDNDEYQLVEDYVDTKMKKRKHKKKKNKKAKPNFPIPKPPSRSSVPGPGYSPQPLSFVSWTQFYANLSRINEAVAKEINGQRTANDLSANGSIAIDTLKKHFRYEVEYNTSDDKVYPMKDLTMRSWLDYAERAGRTKYNPKEINFDPETESDGDEDSIAELVDEQDDRDDETSSSTESECLEYLKLFEEELRSSDLEDDDIWVASFFQSLGSDPLFSHCLEAQIDRNIDINEEEDSIEEPEIQPEQDNDDDSDSDSDADSGDEDDSDASDEDDLSTQKKKKHKKKKNKKRKGEALKKNSLWHTFVRHAFVDSKSSKELRDEFG